MTTAMTDALEIHGTVAAGFEPVADAFAANFKRQDASREVGASLAVYRAGQCLVDLWGGYRDEQGRTPWTADTLVNVWSTTKGITAIALATLVDRGLVDYSAPVATYWPEFAQAGKGAITVAELVSHQAGLPGFTSPMSLTDFLDWQTATSRLAAQAPMWPPGSQNSYHAMTYGFLSGEIIRRVSGKGVRRFVAEEIAGPLGADFHIGLAERDEPRVAPMIPPRTPEPLDPATLAPEALAAMTNPDMVPDLANERAWRAAEVPAGNGHATALALAKIYGALANGGELDGVRLMSPATIAKLTEVQTKRQDVMLGFKPFWAHGVALNDAGVFGPRPDTFGHSGWGGSFACADVETGVAIGYAMNQMGGGLVGDPRAVALCNAVFAAL